MQYIAIFMAVKMTIFLFAQSIYFETSLDSPYSVDLNKLAQLCFIAINNDNNNDSNIAINSNDNISDVSFVNLIFSISLRERLRTH